MLYTRGIDGHPDVGGYRVIGESIAKEIKDTLPGVSSGLYALMSGDQYAIILVSDEGVWYFNDPDMVEKNGWPVGELQVIHDRDLVNLPHRGIIAEVDPSRFGPGCCTSQ